MTSKNTVTQERINYLLDNAEVLEHVFWGKELVVSYRLECGFTISGKAACVDPVNFNFEIGRQIAREKVEDKLWELEGYVLQNKLYEQENGNEG